LTVLPVAVTSPLPPVLQVLRLKTALSCNPVTKVSTWVRPVAVQPPLESPDRALPSGGPAGPRENPDLELALKLSLEIAQAPVRETWPPAVRPR
jgi:hypothetical protein